MCSKFHKHTSNRYLDINVPKSSFLSLTDVPIDQNSNPVSDDLESSNLAYR